MSPDLSSILQRPVSEVIPLLTSLGYAVHIFREDGWTFAVYDPRPHLVNLTVENGVVQSYFYRQEALLFQCLTYQPTSSSDCETDRPKVLSRREIEQIPGRYYNPVAGTWSKAAIYALIQFYFPEHPILRPQPSRRFAWDTTPPADSVSV